MPDSDADILSLVNLRGVVPRETLEGINALDLRIATTLLERPWLSDEQVGEAIGVSKRTVWGRRHKPNYLNLLIALQAPQARTWRAQARPAFRRRIAAMSASKNEMAVLAAADRVMPEELGPAAAGGDRPVQIVVYVDGKLERGPEKR